MHRICRNVRLQLQIPRLTMQRCLAEEERANCAEEVEREEELDAESRTAREGK